MNEKLEWETVETVANGSEPDHMTRTEVPGGWLVRTEVGIDDSNGIGHGVGLCFYPDPDHAWSPSIRK